MFFRIWKKRVSSFFKRFVITKLRKKLDSAILITKKNNKNNIFYVSAATNMT